MVDGTRRSVAEGAGGTAPTAPHATPGSSRLPLTGPERFWTSPWKLVAGAAALLVSFALHYALAPWSLLPQHEFELRDTAGELTIPVEILQGDDAPEPPAPPPPPAREPTRPAVEKGEGLDAGGSLPHPDAAVRPPRDAAVDVAPRPRRVDDAGAPSEAPVHDAGSPNPGARLEGGVARGGAASAPVRDAVGMIGAAGTAQAGPQNVIVTINMAAIRTHPVGARIGPLFAAIPQWDDFLVGTGVDPLRDTDWVSINGPSLIHSEKDVILVHYSAPDAVVDRALDSIAGKAGSGGPYDAGASIKAVLGHADRADRVFMRPQPHIVAVVPPYYAATAARMLAHATIPRAPKRPGEAMRLMLIHPHGPMPAIPESVTELRLWIVPRNADGGADVFGEGDTASVEACASAVDVLKGVIADQNSFGVRLLTHGLLDGVELTADGRTLRFHLPVSRDQLDVLLAFAAGRLGVDLRAGGGDGDGGAPRAAPAGPAPRPAPPPHL